MSRGKRARKILVFLALILLVVLSTRWYLTKPEEQNQPPTKSASAVILQKVDQEEKGGDISYASGSCTNHRGAPTVLSNQNVMNRIQQIKDCPCNVNVVNERNPLCATADTIQDVTQRRGLSYIAEASTPCVFIDNNGDSYKLTDVSADQPTRGYFLNHSTSTELYCMPSVYLPGVPKCGTTTLTSYLTKHQSIKLLNPAGGWSFWHGGGFRERSLFLDDNNHSRYNLFAYMSSARQVSKSISNSIRLKLQSDNNNAKLLDSTLLLDVSQLTYQQQPLAKLTNFVPNRKCIIIMRDPTERVFSFFRFSAQIDGRKDIPWFTDQTPEGFHTYVTDNLQADGTQAFADAIYSKMVRHILDMMPREDTAFIQFEEFIEDTFGVIEEQILPILGLEPFHEDIKFHMSNKNRENPSMHQYKMMPETRILMQNHFQKHNFELSSLLGDTKWTWGY